LKLGDILFIIPYCFFVHIGALIISLSEGETISSIIIDGYNLIGTSHEDLSAERDKLIRLLSEYRKMKVHDITVVFDGWKSGGPKEVTLKTGGIAVIYSRLGENADYVIKRIISRDKREWIVITSDRDIAAFAWANGSIAVPSDRFRAAIGAAGLLTEGEYEPLYEEEDGAPGVRRGKGNPRTPSKKEKALTRALRKL
jgi:predicted RNA-binding protein with PIN domain